MPIPKPKPGEKEDAFLDRCLSAVGDEYDDNDQAVAVCAATWKDSKKKEMNGELLEAIKTRQGKQTEFGYGILTADRYVQNVRDAIGLDKCYKFASTRAASWEDVMQKAASTLVYSNADMMVKDQGVEYFKRAGSTLKSFEGVELPKNTLMVFRHVLTTPRKDRDGDVLRTQGAIVDPKLPLLWQHVHTLPIGKMLLIEEHNSKTLTLVSCIIDVNELCHDSAVMIDNGMDRFSHGFRAIEFTRNKARDGAEEGFDINAFEIMEESLVSVPANTDAEVEEVMLSLVEGGKLTSPLMKEVGKSIRDRQPTRISLPVDLKVTLNGKEIGHEELSGNGKGTGETKDETGTSEKADIGDVGKEEEGTSDAQIRCPECGAMVPKGAKVCPKCGYKFTGKEKPGKEEPEEEKGVKYGRTMSGKNLKTLKDIHKDMSELHTGDHVLSRAGRSLCEKCSGKLKGMIDEYDKYEEPGKMAVAEAMEVVVALATKAQRKALREAFDVTEAVEEQNRTAEQFRSLVGP